MVCPSFGPVCAYELPKGPTAFIARSAAHADRITRTSLMLLYTYTRSPITFWTTKRGIKKKTQKDPSWLLAMTHTGVYYVYKYTYKRSITFRVRSFYCARRFLPFFLLFFFFSALRKNSLYDIHTHVRLCLRRLTIYYKDGVPAPSPQTYAGRRRRRVFCVPLSFCVYILYYTLTVNVFFFFLVPKKK